MTTATATLADFLLRQVESEEAAARRTPPKNLLRTSAHGFYSMVDGHAQHLAVDPARVLADCAARRAIVEAAGRASELYEWGVGIFGEPSDPDVRDEGDVILRHLAAPYASVDGYDEAWAVS